MPNVEWEHVTELHPSCSRHRVINICFLLSFGFTLTEDQFCECEKKTVHSSQETERSLSSSFAVSDQL